LMRIHLVNPSDTSFGIGVITPRWLCVLAAATPAEYGDPLITDETLEQIRPELIAPGDIVGSGIHTGNALRGMQVGLMARERGAWVVYGGIHASLYPQESFDLGGAHACTLGSGSARSLYLGIGANGAHLPQALFLLLGVAHRRTETSPARIGSGDRRERPVAPSRIGVTASGISSVLWLDGGESSDGDLF
jgi:hypothetical protein